MADFKDHHRHDEVGVVSCAGDVALDDLADGVGSENTTVEAGPVEQDFPDEWRQFAAQPKTQALIRLIAGHAEFAADPRSQPGGDTPHLAGTEDRAGVRILDGAESWLPLSHNECLQLLVELPPA